MLKYKKAFRVLKNINSQNFLITLFICIIFPYYVKAQVRQAFTLRGTTQSTPYYEAETKLFNLKGDFLQIGNSNITTSKGNPNGENGNTKVSFNNTDNNPDVINSSSANLVFPETGCENEIVAAYLYWSGRATKRMIASTNNGQNRLGGYILSRTTGGSGNSGYVNFRFTGTNRTQYDFRLSRNGALAYRTAASGAYTSITPTNTYTTGSGNSQKRFVEFSPIIMYDGNDYQIVISAVCREYSESQSSSTAYVDIIYKANGNLLNKNTVKIKAENGTYEDIIAEPENSYYSETADNHMYYSSAEITNIVKNAYSIYGNNTTYTVANIYAGQSPDNYSNDDGTGFYGGWGIVVIYHNPSKKLKDIAIFNGFAYVYNDAGYYDISLSGFRTVLNGAVGVDIGVMAGEGDYSIDGDYLSIRQRNSNNFTTLSVPLSEGGNGNTNNYFHAYINGGTGDNRGITRNPSIRNNTGLDISKISIPNNGNAIINNQQTQTTIRYGTDGDTYCIFNFVFAADAYIFQIDALHHLKTGSPAIPPTGMELGKSYTYEVDIYNYGEIGLNNGIATIQLPKDVVYNGALSIIPANAPINYNSTNNTLTWQMGDIPEAPLNSILAKMEYTITIPDCENITLNSNCTIDPIAFDGFLYGTNPLTNKPIDTRFTIGYNESTVGCILTKDPIKGPLTYVIDLKNCNEPDIQLSSTKQCTGGNAVINFINPKIASNYVYEWQKLENGTWIDIGNASSNQLNLNNLTSTNNGQYRISLKRYNPGNTSGSFCDFSSSSVNINVLSPPLVNINVPDNGILCLGESFNLSTNINNGNWTIDNEQIISIDNNGEVLGKSEGLAQITYTIPENETTCQASASSQIMVGSCSVLPIELLSFNAICSEDETITLNWSTASETKSAYFTLEKSSDAIDFYALGTIPAAGKSFSELQYHYLDKEKNGDSYYRLKQTDLDGFESIYNIINIKCNPTQNQINAYYTRSNQIEIEIISNNTSNYIFNLFQANGKQLYNGGIVTNENKTIFKITPEEHLVQGIYLLQIIHNNQIETKKIWVVG